METSPEPTAPIAPERLTIPLTDRQKAAVEQRIETLRAMQAEIGHAEQALVAFIGGIMTAHDIPGGAALVAIEAGSLILEVPAPSEK